MVTATEAEELLTLEKAVAPLKGGLDGVGVEGGGGGGGGGRLDADLGTRLRYLRLVRKLQLRRSEAVARVGLSVLNDKSARQKLGDEVWDLLEQVAIAAMDCNSLDAAKECVGALIIKFPNSVRVGRLEGMWLEAKGWWDQAERRYADLLEEHPQAQKLQKRRIAMLKGQGRIVEATQALALYLETYQADFDAWRELGDLYISLSMFPRAAFCYEELLLSAPVNPIYNLRYAEILYTMGGLDNLRAARSYYASAVEHSAGESLRALWGACLAHAAVQQAASGGKGGRGQKGDKGGSSAGESSELAQLASQTLAQIYKYRCSDKAETVRAVVAKLVDPQ